MNRSFKNPLFACLLLFVGIYPAFNQQIFFNKVQPPDGKTFVHVTGIVRTGMGTCGCPLKKDFAVTMGIK